MEKIHLDPAGYSAAAGFDWEGRIEIMPALTARVHDAYITGEGILHATLFGLVSLANLRGTPEIALGELMRFLAEAACTRTCRVPVPQTSGFPTTRELSVQAISAFLTMFVLMHLSLLASK